MARLTTAAQRKFLSTPGVMEGLKKAIYMQQAQAQTEMANTGNYGDIYGQTEEGGGMEPGGLGIDVKERARQRGAAAYNQLQAADPGSIAALQQSVLNASTQGDPQGYQGMLEAMKERGVSKVRGGPSPAGSQQLTGVSTQPDFFTTGKTFMGRPNLNYQGTMWDPQQSSAIPGTGSFDEDLKYRQALAGLRGSLIGR